MGGRSHEYWWRCGQCEAEFERLEPTTRYGYGYYAHKRRQFIDTSCARLHEIDNPGHHCARRVAPAV